MYRLITPLDGSALAESALTYSVRLTELFQASLNLIHVIGPSASNESPIFSTQEEADRYLRNVAQRYADRIPVQIHALKGEPNDQMLSFFHQCSDTCVVMTRFGRSNLRLSRFGSVVDSLVHQAHVPILLVDGAGPTGSGDLNEILVPLDGSSVADSALPIAIKLAGNRGRICLIRVVQPASGSRDPQQLYVDAADAIDEAREFLLRTATRLRPQGINVSWEVRFGNPSSEILRASETSGAEVIVMATHGWGEERRWAFGSVTDSVIHHTTTPVLVVPSRRL